MNLPLEFLAKMKNLLGDEYNGFINSYNDERHFGLRINTLKINVEDFLKISPFELQKIPWTSGGFYYTATDRPAKHPYYHAGLYYIQEPSAMAPGEIIGVQSGDKVLDLCAAPGGKSTQVAAKLAGDGLLVSNDISASRIKALVKNIELYGVKNAVVTNETPGKLAQKFKAYFDKIIVDAPCSGEGMFRKDDSAAKSWGIHSVEKCSISQKEILNEASKMLKPGGYILYSTCTFSPEENECTIDNFLKNNKNFELIEIPKHSGIEGGRSVWGNGNAEVEKCARFWPHKVKGEGHFLALLRKTDGEMPNNEVYRSNVNSKNLKDFISFCNQNLNTEIVGNYELYGDYLHILPKDLPSLNGIRVIRPGWFLGIVKKERFEPSHALAMGIERDGAINIINLDKASNNVIKYLKGETLDINAPKGWTLVCVDNFPLGWGKANDSILKNYYPAGWRWMD